MSSGAWRLASSHLMHVLMALSSLRRGPDGTNKKTEIPRIVPNYLPSGKGDTTYDAADKIKRLTVNLRH